ncbi:glycosyltransferase family 2 protein [Helicobacter sp. 23-1044]
MPKVSVIIPAFNAQKHLHTCLKSCISQNLREIEIILVDDKSKDATLQIAQNFAKNDARIKIISHSRNLGTFLARKSGALKARGEFITFLDADDFLSENALDSAYKKARENSADMVHFGISLVPSPKFASLPKLQTQMLENDEILGQIFVKDFKCGFLIACGKLYSANLVCRAFGKLNFINRHLVASEDSALFLVLCALAKKSISAESALYFYTQNPLSLLKSDENSAILKQVENREFLRDNLPILAQDTELAGNIYFGKALKNLQNLMDYFICYSKRFLPQSVGDSAPYIKYSLQSFRFVARWQIAVKLAIYVLSFGKKRL